MLLFALALALNSQHTMTPYAFVNEYTEQLSDQEMLREKTQAAVAEAGTDALLTCVKTTEDQMLMLRGDIGQLSGVRVSSEMAQVQDVADNLVETYQQKLALYSQLSAICSKLASSPETELAYKSAAVEVSKIRARLDFVDKSQLDTATLIFFVLLRKTPDSSGHMSHLSITKAEKEALINKIELNFGAKLEKYPMQSAVAAMAIYRDKLKEFKGSDEPD